MRLFQKVMPLWGFLLGFAHLLFHDITNFFLIQGSNYTTKICLVLYKSFLGKTGPSYICLADFFTTSLSTTRAYTHTHYCSLLKLNTKLHFVIDHFK